MPPVARGLIVLEGSVVHPSDWPYEYAIFGYRAAVMDGYRQIANALHRHGALALARLTHGGMQGESSHYSPIAAVGASAGPGVNSRRLPQAMDADDIAAVIQGFRQAARYARDGGGWKVRLNAGQDSLIRQFLSPLINPAWRRLRRFAGQPAAFRPSDHRKRARRTGS